MRAATSQNNECALAYRNDDGEWAVCAFLHLLKRGITLIYDKKRIFAEKKETND